MKLEEVKWEPVEALIERCRFQDFGMGQEPWDFVKSRLLEKTSKVASLGEVSSGFKEYTKELIVAEEGIDADGSSLFVVNGVLITGRAGSRWGACVVEVVGEFPHRDSGEVTGVYSSRVLSPERTLWGGFESLCRSLIEHECLENFYIDGFRVFDPHAIWSVPR